MGTTYTDKSGATREALGVDILSGGGSGLYSALTNLSGSPVAGSAFTKLLDADANRTGAAFQNTHATDALQVVEAPTTFANAAAAQAAWDAGGGFEVQAKDPYFVDGKGEVWVKRGGSNDITIRGHRG